MNSKLLSMIAMVAIELIKHFLVRQERHVHRLPRDSHRIATTGARRCRPD